MHKFTLLILFFITSFVATAQEKISINAVSKPLTEVIPELEKATDYRFYFDESWAKQQLITINEKQVSLKVVLDKICSQGKISYTFLNGQKVLLTSGIRILTDFSESYSSYLENNKLSKVDSSIYVRPVRKDTTSSKINEEFQLFTIGSPSIKPGQKEAILTGYVKDTETGEPLIGAVVFIDKTQKGTHTNEFGFYTITLPKGQHKLIYQSVGMKSTSRNIQIHSDGKLNVELKSTPTALKEVMVTEKRNNQVRSLQMGMEKLTMKTIKQMPMGFGEPDIIKSTLLLPGVQSVGEAASGFNVRGGSVDQNLILLNDVPIMNTSHFFGFFSGFNSDVIKDVTLYKSGIPAKFGGRSSAVMDISMKDGNRKDLKLKGGISPVFSRITVESPIVKDKCSFVFGARTTYSDWVLKLIDDENIKQSTANFYDLQGNISYDLNDKNSIYLSAYKSHDEFDYHSSDAYAYNSLASTLKWKHIFSPKLYNTVSLGLSNYDYTLQSRGDSVLFSEIKYKLNQNSIKANFAYHPGSNHNVDFGLNSTLYLLAPGKQTPAGARSMVLPKTIENEQALETAIYLGDEFEVSDRLSISAGLRYTLYTAFGPKLVYEYIPGQSKTEESIAGSTSYAKGKIIKAYSAPEFRLAANYKTGDNSSMKFGIDRTNQFIHMISNTAAMSPTDIWKLSDKYLKPQQADQFSLGYYQNLRNNSIEASVETYYKFLHNVLDYKGGADLIMNEHLETDLLNGKGKAYGIEFMIKRKTGRLTGWANYTYSRVLHKLDSEFPEDVVNKGSYFPSNYDKPHEIKVTTNLKLSRRANISSNFQYSTGRPFTAPVAYYLLNGAYRVNYSDRNSLRMDDYVRLDLAATINGNLVKRKLNHSSWTFSVYNVLGRKNPYSIFFRTEKRQVNGYKMSIFGEPVYTLTYNFNIRGNAKDDF